MQKGSSVKLQFKVQQYRTEAVDAVVDVFNPISLTDMLKAKDGDFFISDWLRNRNTVEFLSIWEQVHNPDFDYGGFATISRKVGLNSYKRSVKDRVEKTNAIGLFASPGRYGGTFAHQDIAFEFGMWISPAFKIYLIKEFNRLNNRSLNHVESDGNGNEAGFLNRSAIQQMQILLADAGVADTVWLSQQQIADLFQTSRTNIVEHIRHVYEDGELDEAATCRNFRLVRTEGTRRVSRELPFYNLDLIISVGYRVKSRIATQFRIWATERLREYLLKGFTMDDAKLKNLGGGAYWRELLDRIRDIRSSEKVLYRQVLDLYATSLDYDPRAQESVEFFKIVQNKLHHAAHDSTAAEVTVAKNYLSESELKRPNTLVSAYFDAAEFRAQSHEPTNMRDWLTHLDRLIAAMDAPTLNSAGSVSHKQAAAKADPPAEGEEIR